MDPQPAPRNREALAFSAVCAVALLGVAYLAWQAAGGLGMVVLGLFTLFVAVRLDLEGNRPVAPQMTPDLFAGQLRAEANADPAGKAANRSALAALAGPTRLAMLLGAVLTAGGLVILLLAETAR